MPLKQKKISLTRFTARAVIFYFTSAKLPHFYVVPFLKIYYCCELSCQGIWVCVCFVHQPLPSGWLYLHLAPDWIHCSELNQELFFLLSVFWLAAPRRYWRVRESHLMSLYFFVACVDNMMEWDAAAKRFRWYSFTTVYASVLWTSTSELVTRLKSVKRWCF